MAAELRWKRSSYSNANEDSACVECAGDSRVVRIRDSKDRTGPQLQVAMAGWRAFVVFART
jgi:ribosomal protein S26